MDVCLHMIHICNLDQIGPCTGIQVWKCLVLLNAQTPSPCTQQLPTTHLSIHLSNNAECLWSAQSSTNAWPVVTWPLKKSADLGWLESSQNKQDHPFSPTQIFQMIKENSHDEHSPLDLSLSHYKHSTNLQLFVVTVLPGWGPGAGKGRHVKKNLSAK